MSFSVVNAGETRKKNDGFRLSKEDGITCHLGKWGTSPQCVGKTAGKLKAYFWYNNHHAFDENNHHQRHNSLDVQIFQTIYIFMCHLYINTFYQKIFA